MIGETHYKDRPAVEVCAEKGLRAVFLPQDGGKMASLTDGRQEFLLQVPGARYRSIGPDSSYVAGECSGFDDLFPTVDPCTPETGGRSGLPYPDHGEVCRYPMETALHGGELVFHFTSRQFPYEMTKRVCADENGGIRLDYTFRNFGERPFPFLYAAHLMLAGSPDSRLLTSYAPDAPVRMMFGPSDALSLPRDRLTAFGPDGAAYKFYYTLPFPQGWCRYGSVTGGRGLTVRFDPDRLPYLGVWLNNGGFQGKYNLAPELSTSPYDSPVRAQEAGLGRTLGPGGSISFSLCFSADGGTAGESGKTAAEPADSRENSGEESI